MSLGRLFRTFGGEIVAITCQVIGPDQGAGGGRGQTRLRAIATNKAPLSLIIPYEEMSRISGEALWAVAAVSERLPNWNACHVIGTAPRDG